MSLAAATIVFLATYLVTGVIICAAVMTDPEVVTKLVEDRLRMPDPEADREGPPSLDRLISSVKLDIVFLWPMYLQFLLK